MKMVGVFNRGGGGFVPFPCGVGGYVCRGGGGGGCAQPTPPLSNPNSHCSHSKTTFSQGRRDAMRIGFYRPAEPLCPLRKRLPYPTTRAVSLPPAHPPPHMHPLPHHPPQLHPNLQHHFFQGRRHAMRVGFYHPAEPLCPLRKRLPCPTTRAVSLPPAHPPPHPLPYHPPQLHPNLQHPIYPTAHSPPLHLPSQKLNSQLRQPSHLRPSPPGGS